MYGGSGTDVIPVYPRLSSQDMINIPKQFDYSLVFTKPNVYIKLLPQAETKQELGDLSGI